MNAKTPIQDILYAPSTISSSLNFQSLPHASLMSAHQHQPLSTGPKPYQPPQHYYQQHKNKQSSNNTMVNPSLNSTQHRQSTTTRATPHAQQPRTFKNMVYDPFHNRVNLPHQNSPVKIMRNNNHHKHYPVQQSTNFEKKILYQQQPLQHDVAQQQSLHDVAQRQQDERLELLERYHIYKIEHEQLRRELKQQYDSAAFKTSDELIDPLLCTCQQQSINNNPRCLTSLSKNNNTGIIIANLMVWVFFTLVIMLLGQLLLIVIRLNSLKT